MGEVPIPDVGEVPLAERSTPSANGEYVTDPVDMRNSLIDELEDDEHSHFMGPSKAKTFLRVRRGWGIKSLTGEENEEESESNRARQREQTREATIR